MATNSTSGSVKQPQKLQSAGFDGSEAREYAKETGAEIILTEDPKEAAKDADVIATDV